MFVGHENLDGIIAITYPIRCCNRRPYGIQLFHLSKYFWALGVLSREYAYGITTKTLTTFPEAVSMSELNAPAAPGFEESELLVTSRENALDDIGRGAWTGGDTSKPPKYEQY